MDSFTVGVRITQDDVYEFTLVGELDMEARAPLRDLIDAAIEAGARHVRFDMRQVTFCGSECVGIILHAVRLDVAVTVKPSRQVLRTLEIAGIPPEVVTVEL